MQALADAQRRLGRIVDGFHFMLGFSGWYYQHGTEEENEGDRMLLGKYNLQLDCLDVTADMDNIATTFVSFYKKISLIYFIILNIYLNSIKLLSCSLKNITQLIHHHTEQIKLSLVSVMSVISIKVCVFLYCCLIFQCTKTISTGSLTCGDMNSPTNLMKRNS